MYQHRCWVRFPCKHSLQAGSRERRGGGGGGPWRTYFKYSSVELRKTKAVKPLKKTQACGNMTMTPPHTHPHRPLTPRNETETKTATEGKTSTNGQSERLVQLHMILIIRVPAPPSRLRIETPCTVQACRHGDDDLIRSAG